MTGIDELKYPADRVLNYARNISDHITELQNPCTDDERAEHVGLIEYDIEQLQIHLTSLKAAYNRSMNLTGSGRT